MNSRFTGSDDKVIRKRNYLAVPYLLFIARFGNHYTRSLGLEGNKSVVCKHYLTTLTWMRKNWAWPRFHHLCLGRKWRSCLIINRISFVYPVPIRELSTSHVENRVFFTFTKLVCCCLPFHLIYFSSHLHTNGYHDVSALDEFKFAYLAYKMMAMMSLMSDDDEEEKRIAQVKPRQMNITSWLKRHDLNLKWS